MKLPCRHIVLTATASLLLSLLSACSGEAGDDHALSGAVMLDGSSTVYPISEALAEEFLYEYPRVRVTVGVSGTGGGFKKFIAGEIDINNASRVMKPSEIEEARLQGLDYIEMPVAFDGLSVVVNPNNHWVDHLTVDELNRIWRPDSSVRQWSDVREGWPARPIRLYGPGTDSGTFDYFTEAVNGQSGASRADYTASEDDNVLVQGISGDQDALGFFGYAYYVANSQRLKLVPVDGGEGPVSPTPDTINNGRYQPLSRPVFIYVRSDALQKPQVREFVSFYLEHAGTLAEEVGYIRMNDSDYQASRDAVQAALQEGGAQ